ncbi:MAG: CocE/NonD family hydrolase [Thermoplasmatales archaeon]|nr:CocE/NonD family hydrolase [Thermoplasmatales archaeon]
MKKYLSIGILLMFVVSTVSVSSTVTKTNIDMVTNSQNEPEHDYHDAFITFMMEGLKDYIQYDEDGFIRTTHMVSMRDGIKLATDVYLPIAQNNPHGSIFLRTPYNKDDLYELGVGIALLGWPVIIQDIRGMHASEGVYEGYRKCQVDGPDSLAWIALRDWSNGKVSTVGPSALGITQYFTAGANPPELACQGVMVATPDLHKHAVYQGGEFRKSLVEKWLDGVNAEYLLEEIFENENSSGDTWINVTLEDNWEDVNVPAIHMGGWYDIFLQGTIDGYLGYQKLGGPGAKGKSKLIMGPWWHEGYIEYEQGELTYPENSMQVVELVQMYLDMTNKYTMNENNGFEARPTVWYYLMGDVDVIDAPGNEWRYADDWPIPADYESWYFHENGVLSKTNPSDYDSLTYTYDPINPVPTIGGQNLEIPGGPYDQTSIEGRSDVLIFTSEVLSEPYEATGPIKARLFVSSDCPDTDFTVKLTDVYPDGKSMIITDGILRMRNRNGVDHWEFMESGEIYEVEVDLWSTSYIWNTGHKIRVAVSSSNYPRFLANPNTKDSINNNDTYNIAQNTLYIDDEYQSCIILPEIDQGSSSNPPKKPSKPSGLKQIKVDTLHKYSSSTTDPDNNQIYILFDWGDEKSSGWLGPYDSGKKVSAYHKWTQPGIYQIRAKAKDITGAQSEWSEPFIVTLPRNRNLDNELILKFLEKHPFLDLILNFFIKNNYIYKAT